MMINLIVEDDGDTLLGIGNDRDIISAERLPSGEEDHIYEDDQIDEVEQFINDEPIVIEDEEGDPDYDGGHVDSLDRYRRTQEHVMSWAPVHRR